MKQGLTAKQAALVAYVVEQQSTAMNGGLITTEMAASVLGTTPQSIGLMASRIPCMGTHPDYQGSGATCISYVGDDKPEERFILHKMCVGFYETTYKGWKCELYRSECGGYWSSTVERGSYGDDNWRQECIQSDWDPHTRSELVECIIDFIDVVESGSMAYG